METMTMKVDFGSCRNRKSRTAVRMIPVMMLLQASSTEAWMKAPETVNQKSCMPVGSSPFFTIESNRCRMPLITSIALASPFLTMRNRAAGWPFTYALLRTSRLMNFTSATSRR